MIDYLCVLSHEANAVSRLVDSLELLISNHERTAVKKHADTQQEMYSAAIVAASSRFWTEALMVR